MNKQQEVLKLALEALEETLRTLDDENAKPGGAISDTIWYSEHETLFDYLTTQITALRSALAEQPASGSFTLWENTLCNPLADMRTQTQSAWHDGYASAKAELKALAEQPEQQESEAVHAAWMAGYTEGEREAIEKQPAQQEPVALDVTIEGDAAKLLAAMLEPVLDDEPTPIRLLVGNGHSGHGLYVAAAEYQDEGAALLVNTAPPAQQQDIADLIAGALMVSRGTAYDLMREALATQYAEKNLLGGPAKVFDAMADAIRAGDDYHSVLRQYGYVEAQQQEPVAWGVDWGKAGDQSCVSIIKRLPGGGIEVLATEYGPPASKPWVGLTDEEVTFVWHENEPSPHLFARAIEAKLREKNAAPCKPLTDEQFLEMILRTGTQELVGVATFVGGSIQMQGKIGLLRSAKIIKEFAEAAHGIKGDA